MARISKTLELERLQKLKESGAISEEEYEKMKFDILNDQEESANEPIEDEIEHVQDTSQKKKMNSTVIGFCIAITLVVLISIVTLLITGKSEQADESVHPEVSAVEVLTEDPKVEFVKSISGVWTDHDRLISILYDDDKFQIWENDRLLTSKLGDVDLQNGTVNILFTTIAGTEVVTTLRKLWNMDKTSYNLSLIDANGKSYQLTFVRRISSDDLNRFDLLTKQQTAGALNEGGTEHSDEASVLTSDEALAFASTYIQKAMNTKSAASLENMYANVVNYYNKGNLPLVEVINDKDQYYKKWSSIHNNQSGAVEVLNGENEQQKIISYPYRFLVSNAQKEISGHAIQYITIEKRNGAVIIVGENGKTLSSETKDLTEQVDVEPDDSPSTITSPANEAIGSTYPWEKER